MRLILAVNCEYFKQSSGPLQVQTVQARPTSVGETSGDRVKDVPAFYFTAEIAWVVISSPNLGIPFLLQNATEQEDAQYFQSVFASVLCVAN